MKATKLSLIILSIFALAGCAKNQVENKETGQESKEQPTKQVTVTNNESSEAGEEPKNQLLVFDPHEYQYDVVTGATQTTFGTTPPPLYSKEEKKAKMFWSNQPPLGLLEGNYYKNEGIFTGGNYGIVEIVTNEADNKILNVEFNEFASDSYYEPKYSGLNKRLSDYAFFQAANTRTDITLVTVVNGITYLEKQMRDENRVTGDFYTVQGSSTSARAGFMPLAAELDSEIRKPSNQKYHGYAEKLENGLIARLQVVTEGEKIVDVSYDEYFADTEEEMTDPALKPFYRQSKYYSEEYNQQTNNQFINFADQLTKEINEKQSLEITNDQLKENPSFEVFQNLAEKINLK